ncbi:hypothetical protein O0L34_g15353 [Tuta absoluta]|nr:hypothetical protein O0L34_g15353 [Tuta absoluta]
MYLRNWAKLCFLCCLVGVSIANEYNTTSSDLRSTKVLSRKRRYLVFPDGSSFQLVFCAQNQGYIQIGDIIWFGNTAALAWELPKDPNIFQFLINSENKFYQGNRRQDTHVVYFDDDGKVLAKVPYHKSLIVNPAFAKRSVDTTADGNIIKPITKEELHESQKKRNLLHELDEMSIKFHRDGRKSLYEKVEKILRGLGWSGKECVQRLLCEHSQKSSEQGTFIHEIMKATFTFPRGKKTEEHVDYDEARSVAEDCEKRFSDCEDPHGVLFHTK